MRRDLQGVANDYWSKCMAEDYRPTGPEIRRKYRLDDSQFNSVKRKIRQLAASAGLGWGLFPPTMRYVLVNSTDETEVAKAVIGYQLKHWQEEGLSTDLTVLAFARAGFVSPVFERQVHILASEFDDRIERLNAEVGSNVLAA